MQTHFSLFLSSVTQLFDTDKDEKITREEFTALLRSALGVSNLNMAKLFKEIDADGSGFITFREYTSNAKLHLALLTSFCISNRILWNGNKHIQYFRIIIFCFPYPELHCILMLFSVPVILQLNFKTLPRATRSTPSSSPPTWSFRDTKQCRRRVQVTWNYPARPVQW